MKKIILCSILIVFIKIGYSQAYNKTLSNETHWYTSVCGAFCVTDHYYAKGDTVVNSSTYTFLNKFHYVKNMALREDTVNRQVFFYVFASGKETLIYDFSLTPGDSIEIKNPNSPLPTNAGWHVLDSIKLITLLDGPHRFFYLSEKNGPGTTSWIEGIGSMSLINTPSSEQDLNGVGDLTCFYKDGVKIYEADTLPTGACDTTLLVTDIANTSSIAEKFSISPVPAKDKITIQLDVITKNSNITIYDISGKEILHINQLRNNIISINTMDWKNGIYFAKMQSGNKNYSKKIIIQH